MVSLIQWHLLFSGHTLPREALCLLTPTPMLNYTNTKLSLFYLTLESVHG